MSSLPPADDDERTMMPGKGAPPPDIAVERSVEDDYAQNALPIGTRLGEFEVKGPIGQGGFSIVYLVFDHSLQCDVALKEYMPSSFAARMGGTTVAARSERHAEAFAAGLRSFINEARLLAQFDHPSLLRVKRFWEANGTGYMVMPFYEGLTLKQALSQHEDRPSEMWLRNFLAQVLDALEVLHRASPPCLHRDISPDNILLLKDDRPLLLDFGAARRVISDMAQALTVVLKPGYAPMEQYAEEPSLKQGPWTDIYALAAVVYFAIIGRPPMPSVTRIVSDSLVPVSTACAGRYSPAFLRAIDAALSIKPQDRPQSVAAFRQLLGLSVTASIPTVMFDQTRSAELHEAIAAEPPARRWLKPAIFASVAAAVIIGGAVWWGLSERENILQDASKVKGTIASADKPVELPLPSAQPAAVEQKSTPAPVAATAPPPIAPTAPPPVAPSAEKSFDPLTVLAEVYAARNPDHAVSVAVDKTQVNFRKKEPIGFSITSAKSGYVYVLEVGVEPGGGTSLLLLFPNAVDKKNHISPDTPMALPSDAWPLIAGGPAGIDRFLVIVSERERDFAAAGMRKIGKEGYGEFPRKTAQQLYRAYTGPVPLFAGKATCPAGSQSCPESYGAAVFSVEEVER